MLTLFNLVASVYKDALGARRIVDAARAEPGHIGDRLIWGAAAFLDPVDHLFGQTRADHAVPAHSAEGQNLRVREFFRPAFESKRIAHAVPGLVGGMTALLGAVDRGRDIDAESEVGGLHGFHEI